MYSLSLLELKAIVSVFRRPDIASTADMSDLGSFKLLILIRYLHLSAISFGNRFGFPKKEP